MTNSILDQKLPQILGFDHGPLQLEGGRSTISQGQHFHDASLGFMAAGEDTPKNLKD